MSSKESEQGLPYDKKTNIPEQDPDGGEDEVGAEPADVLVGAGALDGLVVPSLTVTELEPLLWYPSVARIW